MNLRQQRYKRNRLAGMNQRNAAVAAGYSEATALSHSNRLEKVLNVGIVDHLERAGLTDKAIAEKVADWALGQNPKASIASLNLASKIKGHVVEKKAEVHEHRVTVYVSNSRSPKQVLSSRSAEEDLRIGQEI